MSQYYNPSRNRNIFDPHASEPFSVSRSKIDLFMQCPRCFYLDRRVGIARPPGFPFTLNNAVDTLLKKEFDGHRAEKTSHPLMVNYGIDAIPFDHQQLTLWRDNRKGIRFFDESSNLMVTGAIDDLWVNSKQQLHVVDYKATAKSEPVSLDADWQIGYKRQVEVYQWLFRKNRFPVSDTAYFVYCNGKVDRDAFDQRIEFDISLLPYEGNADWISSTLLDIRKTLQSNDLPASAADCDYCRYRDAVTQAEIA